MGFFSSGIKAVVFFSKSVFALERSLKLPNRGVVLGNLWCPSIVASAYPSLPTIVEYMPYKKRLRLRRGGPLNPMRDKI